MCAALRKEEIKGGGTIFNHRKKEQKNNTRIGKGYRLGQPETIQDIWLPDAQRKGHLFCFGTTQIGKTRLIESMVEQDIRRGCSVAAFDPKGDASLLSKIVQIAFEENRHHDLFLVTPIFPSCSAIIDPLMYYFMPEEIVSHVVSGIRAKEDFFINIANETTQVIVDSLLLFAKVRGERPMINFNEIKQRASHGALKDLKSELETMPPSKKRDDVLSSLALILDSGPEYFGKVSSSLRTTLASLSSGSVGDIIGKAQSNKFIKRLEQNKSVILVVQTGSMLTRKTAHIVSRVLLSMIQSFIGRRYLSKQDSVDPPLSIYIDEASNIIYPGIEDLFNKAGGAGVWIQAFTQSQADIEAEIGADRAKKILDNTNTKIFMRVNDVSTAEYISDYSGESRRYSNMPSLGGAITLREVTEKTIMPEHMLNLQTREFFFFSYDGNYKGKTAYVERAYFNVEYPGIDVL
ncbi:MAG: TraM recognition domain-containing protein [Thermodesulfobacteriota bacterium]|nr:TraM recognition domain-containing protein [Thermodesulfobacteriota bacterium]